MRRVGHVTHMGEKIYACRKTEGKKITGRSGNRWKENIKMNPIETG
jgi:hypothetical protein